MQKVNQKNVDAVRYAIALHEAGHIERAVELYGRILKDNPRDFNVLRLLGITKFQQGKLDEAEGLISKSIKYNRNSAEAHYFLGRISWQKQMSERAIFCLKQCVAIDPNHDNALVVLGCIANEAGKHGEAVAFFEQALEINSLAINTWYNYGLALIGMKRFDEALSGLDKALTINPIDADVIALRGLCLHALRRYAEAIVVFDEAISIKPDSPEILLGRGMALEKLGHSKEALGCYDKAIRLRSNNIDALLNRGITLHSLQRYNEALESFDRAIAIKPRSVDAFRNRAITCNEIGRYEEALIYLDEAISIDPKDTETLIVRGLVLKGQGKREEAIAWFEHVSAGKPDCAEAHYHLGLEFYEEGKREQATAHFTRALSVNPGYAAAKLGLSMAQLPVVYEDDTEIETRRAAYQNQLTELSDEISRSGTYRDLTQAIGSIQPFLLAYQGCNDRSLQNVYGSLVCRVMSEAYPSARMPERPRPGERVRVGIVSGYFCNHSNWKIPIKGWLSQLDRREFQIFGYHTGAKKDAETEKAARLCDRFVQGPMSINHWRRAISVDAPHILIYPEVGMDLMAAQLAAQRLATVQCNSWGHPDTSGFPTLDYFLSSDLMEPPGAQEHYTERLVRLPNLSVYYEPVHVQPSALTRSDLGLRTTATLYWCGQSLFKYLPQFDQVFPRIAREVGDCIFAFIQYQSGTYVTEVLKKRLDRAFAACGLKAADYTVFLPRMDQQRFFAAVGQADTILDSIGWSGCNSTLESLPFDLPIVTMTAPLMRGRHSTAILRMMGVTETTASTIDDYISFAVRLARDLPWRTAVKRGIAENKHRVYRDGSCVSGLAEFLSSVARQIDT